MTIDQSESQLVFPEVSETSNLRVSIIYENFASGVRAKSCLDRLARNLKVEANAFAVRFWSFKYLSDAALRNLAAREAAGFEIVLLSTCGSGEPPVPVKEWLTEWLQQREARPCALAVMPDEGGERYAGSTPLLQYLSRIAQVGGLDLVHPFGQPASAPLSDEAVREIVRKAINASRLLEGIADDWQAYRHAGINE